MTEVAEKNIDESSFEDAQFWSTWVSSRSRTRKLPLMLEVLKIPSRIISTSSGNVEDAFWKPKKDKSRSRFLMSAKESLKVAILCVLSKWHRRLSFFWRHSTRILGSLWVSEA